MPSTIGDALIGMVILIFISLVVVPRQFLPLAQQTGHTHSPWEVAHWELLLLGHQAGWGPWPLLWNLIVVRVIELGEQAKRFRGDLRGAGRWRRGLWRHPGEGGWGLLRLWLGRGGQRG